MGTWEEHDKRGEETRFRACINTRKKLGLPTDDDVELYECKDEKCFEVCPSHKNSDDWAVCFDCKTIVDIDDVEVVDGGESYCKSCFKKYYKALIREADADYRKATAVYNGLVEKYQSVLKRL